MPKVFDHEQLDVYQASLDFVVFANDTIAQLPRGSGHLSDQLQRASTSIVLNIAEGAGEFSPSEKARFYRIAKRSATECAAILDVTRRVDVLEEPKHRIGRDILLRIVSMLVGLCKAKRRSGMGAGTGAGTGGCV